MARGHFDYIFVDEAGQACEPEVMIPIKTMAGPETNIILSGDPMQLGPIVRSSIARQLGLQMSYLDRLMALDMYHENEGHGTACVPVLSCYDVECQLMDAIFFSVVKLLKNWRSHAYILDYPNEKFYNSELEPCGDPTITHSLLRWDGLGERNFPIVFHAIAGALCSSTLHVDKLTGGMFQVKTSGKQLHHRSSTEVRRPKSRNMLTI